MTSVKELGATGDGRVDDTPAFIGGIDRLGRGETLVVPSGTYLVEVDKIRLKSHMTLQLDIAAVIQAKPTDREKFAVIRIENAEDVTIEGGTILGERHGHLGTAGQWGHNIWIGPNANGVYIKDITSGFAWGDGFYVGGGGGVSLLRVKADQNRRQGMSIVAVSGLLVTDSTFQKTGGTRPQDGLDVEPDAGDVIEDVLIENCRFLSNQGAGLEIAAKRGTVRRLRVVSAKYQGNKGKAVKSSQWSGFLNLLADLGWYTPTSFTIS